MSYPDCYFGMIEQQRSEAGLSSRKYWDKKEKAAREERKRRREAERRERS